MNRILNAFWSKLIVCLVISLLLGSGLVLRAQILKPDQIDSLRFRHIGPVGNRVISVAGIAENPMVYYVGAASGGIWKTTDGGIIWKPIFDKQRVHSIGSITLAPSETETVWVGTGEHFIRSNVSIGNGVWKSDDGGSSWAHMGLEKTGRISRVIVHPTDPNVVYVAAVGHGYAPQKDRGIFRSQDGGQTWKHVLAVNDSTGASDLVMDPNNPKILFAAMWQLDIKTWRRESGGKGSGIFMSKDGGDTWKRLEGNGLPKTPVGKVALTMSKANSQRIYALIETGDGVPWHGKPTESGELWRSDDGGNRWKLMNHDRNLTGRGAYYTRCQASPDNPDEVYFIAAAWSTTLDGGKTTSAVPGLFHPSVPNWDHHDMWIDPTDGNRMAVVGDGGVSISLNRGKSWHKIQLPVAQLYHVNVDNNIPYYVYANRQDGPSTRGPSRIATDGFWGNDIPRGMWHDVGGGESGFATPDPEDPDLVWSSASGFGAGAGIVVRYNEKTRQYRQVEVWPNASFGSPAKDLKYRFQWTFPLLISPHDNNTIYVTSQYVHRTTNGGQSWQEISPDLSTNDKSKQGVSGGLTPDNIGVEYCCVIYALDESPVQKGVLWAGTNDGLVHVSQDGGDSWSNVTKNIKGLPALGTVRNIEASKWDAGKAYITVDFHQVGNFDPHVYKTTDFGKSWTKITDGIEDGFLSYARCIREDPVRPDLLYLGTENALYFSLNDGSSWQPLMTNLPSSPMYWMVVQEHFNDLVVGTYGRGIWILDDITPLQQLDPSVAKSSAHLFEPRLSYRFRPQTYPFAMSQDPSAGQNAPDGTPINYWLNKDEDVKIQIKDGTGNPVRTIKHTGKAGVNRLWWNMREDSSTLVTMRTKPLFADKFPLKEDNTRPLPTILGPISPLVKPGSYTVTLAASDQEFSQALVVKKDPISEGTEMDIAAQYDMVKALQGHLNSASAMVNEMEMIRQQVYALKNLIKKKEGFADVSEAIQAFDKKVIEIEGELTQLKFTGTGQDFIRWPWKLIGKMKYLASVVETADFRPTDQQEEVYEALKGQLDQVQVRYEELKKSDLPAFLKVMEENGLNAGVVLPGP